MMNNDEIGNKVDKILTALQDCDTYEAVSILITTLSITREVTDVNLEEFDSAVQTGVDLMIGLK